VTMLERPPLDPNMPIDKLVELSVRSYNCLQAAGLQTVGQVRAMTDKELLRLPNLGRWSLHEIRQIVGVARRCTLELTTDELVVLVACVGIAINKGLGQPPGEHEKALARSGPAVTDAVVDKLVAAMREELGAWS
jgi:Bacterial RNA polymerase, alpha chain C terminal domain